MESTGEGHLSVTVRSGSTTSMSWPIYSVPGKTIRIESAARPRFKSSARRIRRLTRLALTSGPRPAHDKSAAWRRANISILSEGHDVPQQLVRLAWPADVARLQHLLERCSDYYELHEGWPTPADAGQYELIPVPPGLMQEDLFVFALQDSGGVLHAMVQLLRNYPQRRTWWIGLLVVAPELRGRGIGSVLLRHASEAAAAERATAIRLAVSVHNPRAESFWAAAGFRPEGQPQTAPARSGHVDTVRIMARVL